MPLVFNNFNLVTMYEIKYISTDNIFLYIEHHYIYSFFANSEVCELWQTIYIFCSKIWKFNSRYVTVKKWNAVAIYHKNLIFKFRKLGIIIVFWLGEKCNNYNSKLPSCIRCHLIISKFNLIMGYHKKKSTKSFDSCLLTFML